MSILLQIVYNVSRMDSVDKTHDHDEVLTLLLLGTA